MNSIKFIIWHLYRSSLGFLRLSCDHPWFAARLMAIRCHYFFTRTFAGPLETPDGFCLKTALELISYWSFFVEREGWSAAWAGQLKHESKPLVLDVGANAGLFAHWIWTQNPRARLVIFEPLPAMAERIRSWAAHTGADVTLHKAAVSNLCGEAKFFTDADNDTGASLLGDGSKKNQLTVPLVTLDSLVPHEPVLLAKIDVEGCEVEALCGAVETLRQTQFLLLEAHTPEALAAIRNILTDATWICQCVGSSDYLFKRRNFMCP